MTATAKTRTGGFLIGYRRLRSDWQRDFVALSAWTLKNRFGFIDFAKTNAASLTESAASGLTAGSVDLLDWNGYLAMIAPDSQARRSMVKATQGSIEDCAGAGAAIFFTVTIPADAKLPRRQNFCYLVESFAALIPVLECTNSRVVIEGRPGPGAVCCTPEAYRAFFKEIGSDRFGVNYDPSHLLRMGIDPLRFLREFASRVYHVHAKDTVLSDEDMYAFGHEQPAVFAEPPGWGGSFWRYTLPGRGRTDWPEVFRILEEAGYEGLVSIELEDEDYNGTEAGEKRGLIEARDFLERC